MCKSVVFLFLNITNVKKQDSNEIELKSFTFQNKKDNLKLEIREKTIHLVHLKRCDSGTHPNSGFLTNRQNSTNVVDATTFLVHCVCVCVRIVCVFGLNSRFELCAPTDNLLC